MPRFNKRAYLLFGAIAVAFAAIASLVLRAFPTPHKPLHYVTAGACATCSVLVVAFVVLRRAASDQDIATPVRRPRPDNAPPA